MFTKVVNKRNLTSTGFSGDGKGVLVKTKGSTLPLEIKCTKKLL